MGRSLFICYNSYLQSLLHPQMMSNLALSEGDTIMVESVSLPVATFSKFQPLSSDFLDITNAKAGNSQFTA